MNRKLVLGLVFAGITALAVLAVACGGDDNEIDAELAVWAASICRASENLDAVVEGNFSTSTNVELLGETLDDLNTVRHPSEAAEYGRNFVNLLTVYHEEAEKRLRGVPLGTDIEEFNREQEARLDRADERFLDTPVSDGVGQALRSAGCGR